MSRTRKDAPYKIRERRLGITDKKENCVLCQDESQRIMTFGFSAIFFAHEVHQRENFIELAQEKGYTVVEREVRGYLGDIAVLDSYGVTRRRMDEFEGTFDQKRAIYSSPSGIPENLLWSNAGPKAPQVNTQKNHLRKLFSNADEDMLDAIFSPKRWTSHKENLFTVVSISQEYTRGRGYYHYHESHHALGYLLNGHCHCSWCEPDEKAEKTRLRSVTSKLRNAFNSGNYDELEEIASELVRSSSGGYRDPMNC